jgi:hypothetical protein
VGVKLGLTPYEKMAFENRVLRRIFRPKKEEVVGRWKIPHNEELQIL